MQLPIPQYCERTAEGILNEPFNAATNVAFFISAFYAYRLLKSKNSIERSYFLMPLVIGLIGLGSALWHTVRLPITLFFDSVPVYLFILITLYFFLRTVIKSPITAFTLIVSYIGLQLVIWLNFSSSLLNNSIRHVINLVAFSILLFFLKKKFITLPKALWMTFIFYGVAIILKMIDMQVCTGFPIGTHFLWHLFNAMASYYAVKSVVELHYESSRTDR